MGESPSSSASARRIHAAEDRVVGLTAGRLALVGALAVAALTAFMLSNRRAVAPADLRIACESVERDRTIIPLLDPSLELPPSGPGQASPRLQLAPVATSVRTPEVELRWRPLPAEMSVRVTLRPLPDGASIESPVLPAGTTSWRPPGLAAGARYEWQVSGAAGPPARFRILSDGEREAIEQLERDFRYDPFLIGVARVQVGLREDARVAFAALREDPQRGALAKRIFDELAR